MGAKESNAGFVGLHTPMGILLVIFSFLFFIAVVAAGSAFFKAGLRRDQEERERLRALSAAKKQDP